MRVLFSLALFGCFTFASIAQTQSANVYRIHKLILTSPDLPTVERQAIIHAFQGGTYKLDELAERIRERARDSGYANVEVDVAEITHLHSTSSTCSADVSYSVHAGSQYRLGEITFHVRPGEPVFSSTRLRAQFPIQSGGIFSAQKIADGLNNLRDLYFSTGYPLFSAIPKDIYDNARQTITLDIDIDQGFLVSFGKLTLEGVEPRAGVSGKLLTSWKEIEGKPYNPQLLKDWLKRSEASWPPEAAAHVYISGADDPRTIVVLLHFLPVLP